MIQKNNSNLCVPVSVIVLTLNEEANILNCLTSIYGWSDDIHIVDSFSEDNTIEFAKRYTQNIHQVGEDHWANIRNWAIKNISLKYDWLLFLDADERLTENLKTEIAETLKTKVDENGFYIRRRFFFMGRWLKHGGLYVTVLRLFKHRFASYVAEGDVEYARVEGFVGLTKNDMIHEDCKGIEKWIEKHNKISGLAAQQSIARSSTVTFGDQGVEIEGGRRTIIKYTVWERIPLSLRPHFTFLYQYFIRLGFLDGVEGLIYHFLQGFWYRLIIYCKVLELNGNIKSKINPSEFDSGGVN
jgi:glycosyltransferase involved in cell wall biosynthesis